MGYDPRQPFSPYGPTYPGQPGGYQSTQPVYPTFDVPDVPGSTGSGGWTDWLGKGWDAVKGFLGDHGGDIVKGAADAGAAYLDYQSKQQALKQQQEQFEKTYGLNVNSQAMQAANAKNRAPLWDKATYLAQNFAPPMPFNPRDYTKGIPNLKGQATGGAAAQMAANNAASANYKQGMGGIDTSVIDSVLQRLGLAPAATQTGPTGPMVLGKPATEGQAADAFARVTGVLNGSNPSLHGILNAAAGTPQGVDTSGTQNHDATHTVLNTADHLWYTPEGIEAWKRAHGQ